MEEFRIVVTLDIYADSPEAAYRRVRELFADVDDVACETTEEWYDESGHRIPEGEVCDIASKILLEELTTPT